IGVSLTLFFDRSEWPQGAKWTTPLRLLFSGIVDGTDVADGTVEWNGSNHQDLRFETGCSRLQSGPFNICQAPTAVWLKGRAVAVLLSKLTALCFLIGRFTLQRRDANPARGNVRELVHKSYADCFDMLGFVGGNCGFRQTQHWSPGLVHHRMSVLAQKNRLLSVYILCAHSLVQLHENATKIAQFADELGKLGPHVDSRSGAWHVILRKHK
ncbi:hypothetical protein LLEC1_06653, partial [Akanthomyces lecanii]